MHINGVDSIEEGAEMATLANSLDELIVRKPTKFKGLTVFPVTLISEDFARSDEEFNIMGTGRVSQYINPKETGEMDRVKISNRSKTRTLVMDGTTIKGGAANRMLLSSAVLGYNEVLDLPACSVEPGRWETMTSDSGKTYITTKNVTFRKSEIGTPSLRRLKLHKSAPLLEGGGADGR
ncbi:ARPP-1 family domain-containing protein [bacterium]